MTTGSRRSKHLAGKAHATAYGCPHVRTTCIYTYIRICIYTRSSCVRIPLSIHGNVYLFFKALVLIRWGRGCTKIRGNRSWSPSARFFPSVPLRQARFFSSLTLSLSPSLELSFFSPLLPFSSSTFAFSFFADVHYARVPASRERPRFIQLVNEFKFDATRG